MVRCGAVTRCVLADEHDGEHVYSTQRAPEQAVCVTCGEAATIWTPTCQMHATPSQAREPAGVDGLDREKVARALYGQGWNDDWNDRGERSKEYWRRQADQFLETLAALAPQPDGGYLTERCSGKQPRPHPEVAFKDGIACRYTERSTGSFVMGHPRCEKCGGQIVGGNTSGHVCMTPRSDHPKPQGFEVKIIDGQPGSPLCAACGHGRDGHRDELGGICIGCPCPGYQPPEAPARRRGFGDETNVPPEPEAAREGE